ncbi:hypothetical protein [Ottowia thiooxydans]|uniref:hypothetical protein n=1 Tax=Ottowia thiooxydans TaxID=219182 RepID=UPI0033984B65
MKRLEQALADFGQEMGVQNLATGPTGVVELRFDHGATLGFFRQGEEVVLHWAEPAPYEGTGLLLRAFKRSSDPSPGDPPLQVGLRQVDGVDKLVLATRLAEDQCDAREFQRVTAWLREFAHALKN